MISKKQWQRYVEKLAAVNATASRLMVEYVEKYGTDDRDALIRYAFAVSQRYGTAAAELACQMFDYTAKLNGLSIADAEPADLSTYEETAIAVNGSLKNNKKVWDAISILVKLAAVNTTLKNGTKYGAKFAWIPFGETCPYCLMIAAKGWQTSNDIAPNGHAEHIHGNCNCTFSVSWDEGTTSVEGYEPNTIASDFLDAAEGADADTRLSLGNKSMINAYRRVLDGRRREEINQRAREAYHAREGEDG